MSYTAPQYVDTKEQAVLALASAIKGEAVTGGDGSVNRALDILADVLAESDVSVPQTDAGAILALAQYASGMVKPEGTIAITENGEGIDVAQYATADVSVSGGGGSQTVTFNLWNAASNSTATIVPTSVKYANVAGQNGLEYADAQFHAITGEFEFEGQTFTLHGVTVEDVPAGSVLKLAFPSPYMLNEQVGLCGMTYWNDSSPSVVTGSVESKDFIVLAPLDGVYVNGKYTLVSGGN